MPREQFQVLTEPMFYILLSLTEKKCGVDIMEAVDDISSGRVNLGPGTLYTLLGKFQKEGIIDEIEVDGRKRTYIITKKGEALLRNEYSRMKQVMEDSREIIGGMDYE